jgi:Mg2+/Co2+ transporter CorB
MAVNRYRIRHRARLQKRSAVLILRLLKRPDRLLGLILIGNNVANILASAIATYIAIETFGATGVVISTSIVTILILVFAEVVPKTMAALYPDKISKFVAWPISILLRMFYPFVWLINGVSNAILILFRVKMTGQTNEPLSREELRSIVYETSGRLPHQYQNMLLGILDLNKVTIDEVMVPGHEVYGIDLELDWELVQEQLINSPYDWIPVCRGNLNEMVGMLHLRDLIYDILAGNKLNKEKVLKQVQEPYFVPESTSLNTQLLNFQKQRKKVALVVDEYGEIKGLITLADILEEIVGEFATTTLSTNKMIQLQPDGSYIAEGSINLRELNKVTGWKLPINGPRTLNGLIIEILETIPKAGISLRINNYPIEIIQIEENRVRFARIFPQTE